MGKAIDDVFKARADPTRRRLLDSLHRQSGQTLSEQSHHAGAHPAVGEGDHGIL